MSRTTQDDPAVKRISAITTAQARLINYCEHVATTSIDRDLYEIIHKACLSVVEQESTLLLKQFYCLLIYCRARANEAGKSDDAGQINKAVEYLYDYDPSVCYHAESKILDAAEKKSGATKSI